MPLNFVRNDITRMKVDAVVNAANNTLLGGGGVDGAIHRAAGPDLLLECSKLGGCLTGEAKITGGYDMDCKYIIHAVGPIWNGGDSGEEALLRACYRNSLKLALEHGCESVAFPLISAGAYGYPKRDAFRIGVEEFRSFLEENEMDIYFVMFDNASYAISTELYGEVRAYIDDSYRGLADEMMEARSFMRNAPPPRSASHHAVKDRFSSVLPSFGSAKKGRLKADYCEDAELTMSGTVPAEKGPIDDINRELRHLDESFSQMLLRKIDESGMKDSECYKKANIDRKHFSKIRSDIHYKPKKQTAVAFAIALGMDLDTAQDFLGKAGYTLTKSSEFDVIIIYCINNRCYDIDRVNEILFAYDQMTLGA